MGSARCGTNKGITRQRKETKQHWCRLSADVPTPCGESLLRSGVPQQEYCDDSLMPQCYLGNCGWSVSSDGRLHHTAKQERRTKDICCAGQVSDWCWNKLDVCRLIQR